MTDATTVTTTVTVAHERTAVLEASLRSAMNRIDGLTAYCEKYHAQIETLEAPPPPSECIATTHYFEEFDVPIKCHWYPLKNKTDPVDVELIGCYVNNNNIAHIIKKSFVKKLKKEFWWKHDEEGGLL